MSKRQKLKRGLGLFVLVLMAFTLIATPVMAQTPSDPSSSSSASVEKASGAETSSAAPQEESSSSSAAPQEESSSSSAAPQEDSSSSSAAPQEDSSSSSAAQQEESSSSSAAPQEDSSSSSAAQQEGSSSSSSTPEDDSSASPSALAVKGVPVAVLAAAEDSMTFVQSANPADSGDTLNPTIVDLGQTVTYTLTFNPGTNIADPTQNIEITDYMPEGMTLVPGSIRFTPAGGVEQTIPDSAYNASGHTITWPLYNQTASGDAVFTFQTTAGQPPEGSWPDTVNLYRNYAVARYTPIDGGYSIVFTDDVFHLLNQEIPTKPSLEKSADPAGGSTPDSPEAVAEGQVVTYTIKFNPGGDVVMGPNSFSLLANPVAFASPALFAAEASAVTPAPFAAEEPGFYASDVVPQGMTLVPGSITLTPAGAETQSIPDSAYDAATRTIHWPTFEQWVFGYTIFTFQVTVDPLPAETGTRQYQNQGVMNVVGVPADVDYPSELKSNVIYHEQVVEVEKASELTSRTVVASWKDNENRGGTRPQSILVQLYSNNTPYGEPVTLTSANNWSYTWSSLPLQQNGENIQYTMQEIGTVPSYKTSLDQELFTITNTLEEPARQLPPPAQSQQSSATSLATVAVVQASSPRTGDSSQSSLFIALAVVSGLLILGVGASYWLKKRSEFKRKSGK